MNLFILRWNPNISSYTKENHEDLVMHIKQDLQPENFNWSIREYKDLHKNDMFILQQVGTDNDGIAMIGKFKDVCYEDDSWRKDGSKIYYADMWIMDAFDCYSQNPLPADRYQELFPQIQWHNGHSGVVVEEDLDDKLVNQIEQDLITAGIWKHGYLDGFMAYDFTKTGPFLDSAGSDRPTPQQLADGKILLALKDNYFNNKSEENFTQVLCCLRDSVILAPFRIEYSGKKKNKAPKMVVKDILEESFDSDKKYYPMVLTNDNEQDFFPIFSNLDQIGDNYKDVECHVYKIPFLDCISLLKDIDDCYGFVLDGFTKPFVITNELAEIISQLKYKDETDDEEEE